MKRLWLICLLIFLLTNETSFAAVLPDSLANAALADVKKFRLGKTELKIFRKDRKNASSDFFKPMPANVSNTAYLQDSVFVRTFRQEAYKMTKKRRTAGHYILWGGIIGVGIYTLIGLGQVADQVGEMDFHR